MLEWIANLALVLLEQGKYVEANAISQQTLQLQEAVLGKEHPDTLGSIMNLAESLLQQGKDTKDKAMYQQ